MKNIVLLFFTITLSISPAAERSRSSANYDILTDALDRGGVTASSANYQNTGSAGLISGIASAASGGGVNKSGYVGQLVFGGPVLISSVSRKMHGTEVFDIALPLTGAAGVECRTGGATNDYQIVFTFASSVTFTDAAVTAGAGSVSSTSGNGTTTVAVNLTGVTSAQRLTVTLLGVNDGTSTGDVSVQMGVLVGDTSANGAVNAGDVAQTKSRIGHTVDATNFRSDVNANGSINASDASIVKSKTGTALPP